MAEARMTDRVNSYAAARHAKIRAAEEALGDAERRLRLARDPDDIRAAQEHVEWLKNAARSARAAFR